MTRVIAIDVLIEPDAVLAERAYELNARLRIDHPQGLVLDATHVPHVSLLHRFVQHDRLPQLTTALSPILSRSALRHGQLRATGCEVSDWQGEISVAIGVQRTPALQDLQAEIERVVAPFAAASGGPDAFVRAPGPAEIDAFTIDYVTRFVPERMGERWNPHVTIGSASPRMGAALRDEKLAPFNFDIAGFAIYQLGNLGTARFKLWPD